jgi:hypothetical protein
MVKFALTLAAAGCVIEDLERLHGKVWIVVVYKEAKDPLWLLA